MKCYCSSVLLYAYSLEETLTISRKIGYDGVELWHIHLLNTGEDPAAVGRKAADLGLELSVHALSWDLNFTSALPEIREASLRLLESSLNTAAALGAPRVIVHPGHMTDSTGGVDRYWEYLVSGVTRLADAAARKGLELSVEIMEPIAKEFFIAPEDAARLLERVNRENLTITFDAAHVPFNQDPLELFRRTPGVRHLHLSDAHESKFHLPLGEGKRDFLPLLRYAQQVDPGMIVALEGIEYRRTTLLAEQNYQYFTREAQQAGQ